MYRPIKILLFSSLLFSGPLAFGQPSRHIIQLKDKQGTGYQVENPSAFLSLRALQRRQRMHIKIDSTDLPVSRVYIDSILAAGRVTILNTSRWFNRVLIQTTDAAALAKIRSLPFVQSSRPLAAKPETIVALNPGKFDISWLPITGQPAAPQRSATNQLNYGTTAAQVSIHNGEYLHNLGYRGKGMIIAVLDAGFQGYLTNRAFDSVRISSRILGTWDFVQNEASVHEDHPHGMHCFSIMAAHLPGVLVGTATEASYYLFRTEDAATEYPVEEQNWTAAAERADSLGVDMISSSLGYYQFDDPAYNYTYAQLDGETTIVTRAADMAARKGMIVTNSAGNSGSSSWRYINAPADGDSVLAIGAVNASGQVASFSSYGPSADGRVKPDVASVGWGTFVASTSGTAIAGNGTSFSNPNLAGLIACLWQAFPDFSNMEILEAVKKSANRFTNPDDRTGYGIPDMKLAYESLLSEQQRRNQDRILGGALLKVFPVPFQDQLTILYKATVTGSLDISLVDASGKKLDGRKETVTEGNVYNLKLRPGQLPAGVYFIRYSDGKNKGTIRILK